jgi:hypothetical protein
MSAAHTGRKITHEHAAKISKALTGKKREPFSKEWREHLGASNRGKKRAPYKTRLQRGPDGRFMSPPEAERQVAV